MQQTSHGNILHDMAALERRMAAQPSSPLFTRLAAEYIQNNRPAQALKVCLQGMRHHPEYATGLLLIARAQVMLRQYSDARESLHELLRILPVSPAARALLDRMKELELEYPPYTAVGGSAFVHTPVERDPAAGREEKWSRKDNILPEFELPKHPEPEMPSAPEPEAESSAPVAGLDLAGLANRLETARIPALPEEEVRQGQAEDDASGVEEVNLHVRPVTETLISIYVQQGKLREAIDAYRRLAEMHKDRSEEFAEKIRGLEARLQQD